MANFPVVSVSSHFRNSQKRFNKHEFRTKSMQKRTKRTQTPKPRNRKACVPQPSARAGEDDNSTDVIAQPRPIPGRPVVSLGRLLFCFLNQRTTIPIYPAFWIDHESIHSNVFCNAALWHLTIPIYSTFCVDHEHLKNSTVFCNV
jgi:hypothetical protein